MFPVWRADPSGIVILPIASIANLKPLPVSDPATRFSGAPGQDSQITRASGRPDGPKRLAFLSPVFISEGSTGGLSSYLNNITRACVAAGHQPEVFVLSWKPPVTYDFNGVKVHLVSFKPTSGWPLWATRIPNVKGLRRVREAARALVRAKQLALAFEARNREMPFDLVQSTDLWATGLCIRPRPGLTHLVRCSNPIELYQQLEPNTPTDGWEWRLELRSVARTPIAYAPSKLTADYYASRLKRKVHVCRPPAYNDAPGIDHPPGEAVRGLPSRYLLYFGEYLGIRKGAMWLASALPLAWKQAPDLTLLIAGRFFDVQLSQLQAMWDEKDRDKVKYLGRLSKPDLFHVLRGACAAVLPSLVDNLPNCAYESLWRGIPVIGTRGASIDELVDDGITGELAKSLDAQDLANKMVALWKGTSAVRPGFKWESPIARQMEPKAAVESLLRLAESESLRVS